METIYFKGVPVHTYGDVPAAGQKAPDFTLVTKDLAEINLADFAGKKLVLNVFPSLDTGVCAASVRRFNKEAADMDDVAVVCVSMDLPFAMNRFCVAEGIDKVVAASAFRSPEFAHNYGMLMVDGPLKGLLARCVLVIDKDGKVVYRELVDEITHEPDYEAAIGMLK